MPQSSNLAGLSIPKWQIALSLGAAGAIGFGYWYLKSPKDHSETISIDEAKEEPKELTPLEVSQQLKREGNELFKKGKYDEAILFYNKAIEACPKEFETDLAMYYQNRAAAYENLKKWSSVIADCAKALEFNPKYEKALMRKARAEESIKDWENCLDDITCVCLLQKFANQSALLMADRVLKELGKKHAAEAMVNRKPVVPSRNFIKTYFSSFSQDPVHRKLMEVDEPLGEGELKGFLKAKLAFATKKYEEIIPACTEEINSSESESPYLIEALSLRATFHFLQGTFKNALEDLSTVISTEDADIKIKVNCLIKRASIHMQTENMPACLKDFDQAAVLGPDVSDVFHHRGQVKLLMERTDDAMSDFNRAVELSPDFSVAYVQKCYTDYRYAMQTKDADALVESMLAFRKGTERFPNCVESYVLYAQVLVEKTDFEQADKMYKKALQIDSENASIYVHRGLLQLQWHADIDKAVKLIKQAIEVDDKCEFAYETLGTVEVQRGNLLIAIELFNKAITLARTELELTHLFSLRDAATSQQKITARLGLESNYVNRS